MSEEKAQAKPAPKAAKPATTSSTSSNLVKCAVVRGGFYVQPSTGIRISGSNPTELKDDSWLNVQVKAGLIKKV